MQTLNQRYEAKPWGSSGGWFIFDTQGSGSIHKDGTHVVYDKDAAESLATALNIGHTFNHLQAAEIPTQNVLEAKPKELPEPKKPMLRFGGYNIAEYLDGPWYNDRTVTIYKTDFEYDINPPISGQIYFGNELQAEFESSEQQQQMYLNNRRLVFRNVGFNVPYVTDIWYRYGKLYVKYKLVPPKDHTIYLQYRTNNGVNCNEALLFKLPWMFYSSDGKPAKNRLLVAVPPCAEVLNPKHLDFPKIFSRGPNKDMQLVWSAGDVQVIEYQATGPAKHNLKFWKFKYLHHRVARFGGRINVESRDKFDGYSVMEFCLCQKNGGNWEEIIR